MDNSNKLLGIYKFYRAETGVWEDVQQELWCWEAYYQDGTILKQFDDHGRFHQVKEIDQAKLRFFKMRCALPAVKTVFTLDFDPNYMQLVHLYRIAEIKSVVTNDYFVDAQGKIKIYLFGYTSKDTVLKNGLPKKVINQTINAILPSGELITTDDINNIELI